MFSFRAACCGQSARIVTFRNRVFGELGKTAFTEEQNQGTSRGKPLNR